MKVTPILDNPNFHNETSLRPVFINNRGFIFNKYDSEKYTVEKLDAIESGLKPMFMNKSGVVVDKNETETYATQTLDAIERGEYYKMLFNVDYYYSHPADNTSGNADDNAADNRADNKNDNKIFSYMVYAIDVVNNLLFE